MPIALVMLGAALFTLIAPQIFHRWDSQKSLERGEAYKAFAAEFLDSVQGLATLKSFGQSTARARKLKDTAHALFKSTMWVLMTTRSRAHHRYRDHARCRGHAGLWRLSGG